MHISVNELVALAKKNGLAIAHDCGGYRVINDMHSNVFPADGICPVASRKECYTFLLGYQAGTKKQNT